MTTLPRQCLVAPPIEHHALANPAQALREALDHTWASEPWKGRRVALAIGSRGVDRNGYRAEFLTLVRKAKNVRPVTCVRSTVADGPSASIRPDHEAEPSLCGLAVVQSCRCLHFFQQRT